MKEDFFSRRFFPRCFSLSLSIFPSFSSPFLWRTLHYYLSFLQGPSLFFFFTLPTGFELLILYRLRHTSSLSSIPLFYMCFLPIEGKFQNYISNTLFKFQKLTLKSFSSPLKHVGFCTKKWDVSPRSKESGSLAAFAVKPRPASLYH